jgi:hypothetical protein
MSPISCLVGVLDIRGGIGTLSPLRIRSADGTITGRGSFDIYRRQINRYHRRERGAHDQPVRARRPPPRQRLVRSSDDPSGNSLACRSCSARGRRRRKPAVAQPAAVRAAQSVLVSPRRLVRARWSCRVAVRTGGSSAAPLGIRHQFPQIAATLLVLARYWTTTRSAGERWRH